MIGSGILRRSKKLEKNGISHDRYMELVYFCKQYKEKKEKLESGFNSGNEIFINAEN